MADALSWLEANQLLRKAPRSRPGRPTEIILLHESGSGENYFTPGKPPEDGAPYPGEDRYVQLPAEFWTSGWLAVLSAPAIAMLLVMLDFRPQAKPRFFIAPSLADRHYALSEDTRSAGVAELRWHSLIHVSKGPVGEDFGWRRVRNEYQVDEERLKQSPAPAGSRAQR